MSVTRLIASILTITLISYLYTRFSRWQIRRLLAKGRRITATLLDTGLPLGKRTINYSYTTRSGEQVSKSIDYKQSKRQRITCGFMDQNHQFLTRSYPVGTVAELAALEQGQKITLVAMSANPASALPEIFLQKSVNQPFYCSVLFRALMVFVITKFVLHALLK